jgi:hypothetical protein
MYRRIIHMAKSAFIEGFYLIGARHLPVFLNFLREKPCLHLE